MQWKKILAGICGFGLGFWLSIPRDTMLLPRYEVLVTDASGKGFAGAYVEQVRQDYAVTGAVSSTFATADSYGRAAFPAIHAHTFPLHRMIVCAQQKLHHAPCGYLQQITAEVPAYTEASRSESDLPLKNRGRLLHITMRPN